jgi:hypothetical protein
MISGRCHCGKTSFLIDAELPDELTFCDCSICRKRGTLHAYFSPEQFSVSTQEDRIYRFGPRVVTSHFCGQCGCATYCESPKFSADGTWDEASRIIAVNARLFDDFMAHEVPVTLVRGKDRG